MYDKRKSIVIIIVSVVSLILLHNAFLNVLANVSSIFRKDNTASLEVQAYKQKIEYLEKQILEYQTAKENLQIYQGTSYILAKIALRNIYDFYDSIIISTEKKVSVSSPVINENGLVGFISEADGTTAKVELLTINHKLSVKVCDSYALLSKYSKKDNLIILSNVNNYADITAGCIVTTSGLQGIMEGLKIGEVVNVETKGIEKLVYVKPYVNYDDLNYLYVIEK